MKTLGIYRIDIMDPCWRPKILVQKFMELKVSLYYGLDSMGRVVRETDLYCSNLSVPDFPNVWHFRLGFRQF